MVERVAMLVREAARGGAFKSGRYVISSWCDPKQMGLILSDLGCVVVGEEPSEDQEKPPVKIFERKLKNRERKNVKFGRVTTNSNKPAHAKLKGGGKENFGKTGNKSFRKSVQNKQVNPNSPFAVLATLKKKT